MNPPLCEFPTSSTLHFGSGHSQADVGARLRSLRIGFYKVTDVAISFQPAADDRHRLGRLCVSIAAA